MCMISVYMGNLQRRIKADQTAIFIYLGNEG